VSIGTGKPEPCVAVDFRIGQAVLASRKCIPWLNATPGPFLEIAAFHRMVIMKTHWIAAALVSSTLAMACAGSGENTANSAPAAAPAPEQAATSQAAPPAPSPTAEAARPEPAPAPRLKPAPARTASAPVRLEEAPRAAAPPRPRFREVSAPTGTELALELTTPLSTETAQIETPVTARLRRSVVVNGLTVFPVGSVFYGNVTEVERAGRVRGRSHLAFRFTEVEIAGQRDQARTNVLSFEGEATKSEDATKVGAGAGIGAVIGGIVGGGSGAAKGAAIGAAAGTGTVLATRGRDVVLPAGSEIAATLSSPFEVRVEVE